MGMIEDMRDAVEMNGGRLTEQAYLDAVKSLIEGRGGSTTVASLKSNAFNTNRMNEAEVCRVSVGNGRAAVKEVWLQSFADAILTGGGIPLAGGPDISPNIAAPEPSGDGFFYGIRRRDADEYPEHIQQYIIPRGTLRYVESEANEMRLLSVAFKMGFNVSMNGPKGCGKTMAMRAWASEVGIPFIRINCSEGFTEESFVGYNTLIDGQVEWIDGVLPLSLRYGALLCFDEFRHARPEIMTAWNPVGDSGSMMLPQNNNEVIHAHEDFRTFATMNPVEGYSGGQDINQATVDRFGMALEATYLGETDEMRVICEQSGANNPALARQLVQLANDLRRLKNEHDLESDTSTRMLVDMMKASEAMNTNELVEYIMVGRYQPHEIELIKTAARARLADY